MKKVWIVTEQDAYDSESPKVTAFINEKDAFHLYLNKRGTDNDSEFSVNADDIVYSDGAIIVSLKLVEIK